MKRKTRIKRTAKWHKFVTLDEMRHLKEMNSLSLRVLRNNIDAMNERRAKNPIAPWNAMGCGECRHIFNKLTNAGVRV